MAMAENWYAVYTKPRWEKKVAEVLTREQIRNYCPLNRVVRQWSDRKKTVYEPLFTSYVFVHLPEKKLGLLHPVDGILHLVSWLGKPAVIRDEEIEVIRQFLQTHQQVRLEKSRMAIDDQVRVTSGTFANQQGTVVGLHNNALKVALPSLGYLMYAVLEQSSVEKIH
ncbi:MAG: transcription termination/antitermination protein NusG [Adhaeribacter sp.]